MLGIISSFLVFGLFFHVSCCFHREVSDAGPKASFGACKESLKKGCDTQEFHCRAARAVEWEQGDIGVSKVWRKMGVDGKLDWILGKACLGSEARWRLGDAGGSSLGGLRKCNITSPFNEYQQSELCQPNTGEALKSPNEKDRVSAFGELSAGRSSLGLSFRK